MSKDKWISVKDRLPEQFKIILAIDSDGDYHLTAVDASGILDEYSIGEDEDSPTYTHWMPLPLPPSSK